MEEMGALAREQDVPPLEHFLGYDWSELDPAEREAVVRIATECYTCYHWLPEIFQGVKGYRAALSRQTAWVHEYARRALNRHAVACTYCGGPAALTRYSGVGDWMAVRRRPRSRCHLRRIVAGFARV